MVRGAPIWKTNTMAMTADTGIGLNRWARGWSAGLASAAAAASLLGGTVGCALLGGRPLPDAVCDVSAVVLDDVAPDSVSKTTTAASSVPVAPEEVAEPQGPAKAVKTAGDAPMVKSGAVGGTNGGSGATDYRIQPLDSVRLDVFGEPDISGVFPVSAEGAVRHPLLGTVPIAGLTVAEAERQMLALLGEKYLVNPRVSVRVEHSTGRRITILGEIKKPGTYSLPPEQPLTLLGLVANAGGFTDIADTKRVRILRDTGDSRDNTIRVNVNDLLKGRLDQTDVKLLPGDVIMVPESIF